MSKSTSESKRPKFLRIGLRASIMEALDIGPLAAATLLLALMTVFVAGVVFFVRSAPPSEITFTSGREGSMFHRTALRYQKALEANGVKVNVLTSQGSIENLERLTRKKPEAQIALIQSGIAETEDANLENIVSLGAISNQPVFYFYRGVENDRLSNAKGKTIAVGREGSGTRKIALKLLELNGISESESSGTQLLGLDADDAVQALIEKKIDGAFVMGENVAVKDLRRLMHSEGIYLMNFKRYSSAYIRKLDYLGALDLPEGVIDFAQNIPPTNVSLVGPMVELIAVSDLHPALSDLILDAAMTIHSRPGLFQKRGEFPMPMGHTIKLSDDADRFYKSGKTFLYRHLPFWLASLVSRILVVIIPMLVVLVPIVRLIPWLFRWRNQLRIRRLYRALMQIEEAYKRETDPAKIVELHKNFDRIDNLIRDMRVRPAFAEQFYHLRKHIDYVKRSRLK